MHVNPNPLLNEYREECCGKAEDEGHEPESIHADVKWRWAESGVRRWRRGRDGDLGGDRGYLLRNLCEHCDVLLQVVYHLVFWAYAQILLAVDYERGESSGK